MVNTFLMYPSYCFHCGSKLIWQSDFNYEDVYQDEGVEGLVTFHMCSNEECGVILQADISAENGMERIIPFQTNDE